MTAPISPESWTLTEGYVAEDAHLAAARTAAVEVGLTPLSPGAGAALRFIASLVDAKAAVEVGTGTGVSGLWLLRGMQDDGVLTTIDLEAEHHRLARDVFTAAGIAPTRARTITGAALDILPRLTDHHYDVVLLSGAVLEFGAYLDEALRLLRPGGVVVIAGVLADGALADPSRRDAATLALRGLVARIAEDDRLVPVLLPVGDGLLAARLA